MQDFEEEKHRSEAHCCKAMQDMDCMRVDIWSLVAKVEMEENHALMEMQDLDSERQIKEFMGLLASKEQKLQKLIFAINKVKEEKKTKQEQDGKHGETSGRGERYDSVYGEKLIRLIYEVSKHKMILLTTRRKKEKSEQSLEISNKNSNYAFEYVARLEVKVGKFNPEAAQPWKNRNNALTKAHRTLTKAKEIEVQEGKV